MSVTLICFVLVLYWLDIYKYAGLALVLLLFLVSHSIITADFLIQSENSIRYQNSARRAILELDSTAAEFLMSRGLWPSAKNIKILKCFDTKVAFIGFLPSPLIKERPDLPNPALFTRRVQNIDLRTIEALVEFGSRTENDEDKIEIAARVKHGVDAVSPGDIFPRSVACSEASVPLFPVLEMVPYFEDETANLTIVYDKLHSLREKIDTNTIELVDIIGLNDELPIGKYKTFMELVQHVLLSKVMKGGLLVESKVELISNACVLVEKVPELQKPPFSNIKLALERNAISEFGSWVSSIPLCKWRAAPATDTNYHVDAALSPMQKRLDECFSQKQIDFIACMRPSLDNTNSNQVLMRTFSDTEEAISYLDAKLDDYVIASEGTFYLTEELLKKDLCPKLRDTTEDRHFLKARLYKLAERLEKSSCSSPKEYGTFLLDLRREYSAWEQCVKSRSTDKWLGLDKKLDAKLLTIWKIRCGVKIKSYGDIPPFLNDMDDFAGDIDFLEIRNELNLLKSFVNNETIEKFSLYFDIYLNFVSTVCRGQDYFRCFSRILGGTLSTDSLEEETSKLIEYFKEKTNNGETLESIALKSSDPVLTRVLCDATRLGKIEKHLGVKHDEYCDNRGLRMYRDISKPRLVAEKRKVIPLSDK